MHKIKRYANRKLYDTTAKKYVRLDEIADLIKNGTEEISVIGNDTGEDLTSSIVSQILAKDKKAKSNDLAAGVLIRLLRMGYPGPWWNTAKNMSLFGIRH